MATSDTDQYSWHGVAVRTEKVCLPFFWFTPGRPSAMGWRRIADVRSSSCPLYSSSGEPALGHSPTSPCIPQPSSWPLLIPLWLSPHATYRSGQFQLHRVQGQIIPAIYCAGADNSSNNKCFAFNYQWRRQLGFSTFGQFGSWHQRKEIRR